MPSTVRREVLEEAGWTIGSPRLLGFMNFHHLAPRPPGYAFPHPDFIQVIYAAHAAASHPEARLPDDYEIKAYFLPLPMVRSLALTPSERLYLIAALDQ